MRLPPKKTIEKMITKAKKLWGLTDWEIGFEWGECYEATIDPAHFTEHRATITIDRTTAREVDRKRLLRILAHEVGHGVVAPIWRGVSDWADHHITDKKERDIFEECVNTRENEVIDHIISCVFGL